VLKEGGGLTVVDAEQINPRVLAWARETAGLSVAEAAEKLGLKDTAKTSAIEKLQALEDGSRDPAQGTLQKGDCPESGGIMPLSQFAEMVRSRD
jgi:hypothetical protein